METYKKLIVEYVQHNYEKSQNVRKFALERLRQLNNIKVIMWGAGAVGVRLYETYKEKGIKVDYFCDNDKTKWNTEIIDNIECISTADLYLNYTNENSVIILSLYAQFEVKEELSKRNYTHIIMPSLEYVSGNSEKLYEIGKNKTISNIENLMDMLEDEESKLLAFKILTNMYSPDEVVDYSFCSQIYNDKIYYPENLFSLNSKDNIVDCGAYTADTLEQMCDLYKINFNKYIMYELDKNNFRKQKKVLDKFGDRNIYSYNKGCGDENIKINYCSVGEGSKSSDFGEITGEICRLDDEKNAQDATFIKMDIEGAEIEALRGAEGIICRNKPCLAISIYHSPIDIYEIPFYIKKLVPDYKLYIRHHSKNICDTVLYAVV